MFLEEMSITLIVYTVFEQTAANLPWPFCEIIGLTAFSN